MVEHQKVVIGGAFIPIKDGLFTDTTQLKHVAHSYTNPNGNPWSITYTQGEISQTFESDSNGVINEDTLSQGELPPTLSGHQNRGVGKNSLNNSFASNAFNITMQFEGDEPEYINYKWYNILLYDDHGNNTIRYV